MAERCLQVWLKLAEAMRQMLRPARAEPVRSCADCSADELDELAVPEFDPRPPADTFIW